MCGPGSVGIFTFRQFHFENLRMLKTLPHNALFDGCAFGLKYKGSYLKKPWRIATDHVRLAAALDGQLCRGDHSHAVTIGKAAKASEAYPPRLARCITDAFLEEL